MYEKNRAEFDKLHLTEYLKRFPAKGRGIAVLDDGYMPHSWTKVILPYNNHKSTTGVSNFHKPLVCACIREVYEDVNIYAFNWFGDAYRSAEWLRDNQDLYDVIVASISQPKGTDAEAWGIVSKLNKPIFISSGNAGRNSLDYPACLPFAIPVGAVAENTDKIRDYSNQGVCCVSYTDIWIRNSKNEYKVCFGGTSSATPMAACILEMFNLVNIGHGLRPMNVLEAKKCIDLSSHDMGAKGDDNVYGNGLFKLPPIDEVDFKSEFGCSYYFDYRLWNIA